MLKKLKGDPLGFFNILSQNSKKKLMGGPFGENIFPKKSLAMPKKTERWDPLVLSGIVCYAGNLFGYVTWETFLVQFLGQTGTIWRLRKML